MNCSCFVLILSEKIIDIRNNLDNVTKNLFSKNATNLISFYKKYENICTNLCPVDCIDDEFILMNKHQL